MERRVESCTHCGQAMVFRTVTLFRQKKKKIYAFKDTPAQVCLNCGERWYAAETLKIMDDMIRGSLDFPHHVVEAIEFRFSEATVS